MLTILHSLGWALLAWLAVVTIGLIAMLVFRMKRVEVSLPVKFYAGLIAFIVFLLTL